MSSVLSSNDEHGLSFSPINMFTTAVSNHVGLRVYSDTRPHNWKIADLQKGLILVFKGTEIVGEGTGFGLPVLVCSDETYFSGTSRVYLSRYGSRWIIRKEFVMDRISRNKFRNVNLENRTVRSFFAYLASLYQKHSRFRFLSFKKFTGEISIGTTFLKAEPLGKVMVTFTIDRQRILVKADFSHLKRERIRGIFMLNEQGSRFFRKYVDSQEISLADEEIGAWNGINAEWASLIDPQSGFGFRLWRLGGCVLRRGREFLKDSLDWVGLDYEVRPGNAGLEYVIEILGV
jgi:hypothetical protein